MIDKAYLWDEIKRMRVEVRRLAQGHDEFRRANQLLTAENERLRDALRPAVREYVEWQRERDTCDEGADDE